MEIPFWKDIRNIILFPANARTSAMLAIAAVAFSLGRIFEDLMRLCPWFMKFYVPFYALGGVAWFFMVIILPNFLRGIVWETAKGKDDIPSWPGFDNPWGGVILPSLKSLLVLMWSWLPLVLVLTAVAKSEASPSLPILILSLAYGGLYFPMAFLMFAISGKLWPSLLPSNVVEAVARTFADYLKLVVLFWLLLLPALASVMLWNLPLIGALVPTFVSLYCWAAAMRLLGRFYRFEEKNLEWDVKTNGSS